MTRPTQQPHTRPITEAIGASDMLGRLLARVRDSQARFKLVQTVLPPSLRAHVHPGTLDEEGWNLLAANGAVAAKLRQCLPLIDQVLREAGWPATPLKVKVQGAQR